MKNIINLSKSNSLILNNIKTYKEKVDYKCIEGSINEEGIILGKSGKKINVSKSYSNMKGIGFKESLLEYETIKCITSIDNNMDKYILGASPSNNNIGIVIDINSGKYYKEMLSILNSYNASAGLLVSEVFLRNNEVNSDVILFKGNSDNDFNLFNKQVKKLNIKNVYCAKTNEYDVVSICHKNSYSSFLVRNIISSNLLYNIKNTLSKGEIIYIKENIYMLNELSASIKYIKSKGIEIISIDKLVF